ncbi:MAG: recombination protein RecR [Ruminococcaceae bacterium]|nr:recombination protein RecR [Oscillospiraceae bacterium]
MAEFIEPIEIIIEQLRSLPGVGRKSAIRMAFGVAEMDSEKLERFANVLLEAKRAIKECTVCHNLSTSELCSVCSSPERDGSIICVVEDVKALMAIEKVRSFKGVFHVLGGTISPIDGRGPDDINVASLLDRVNNGGVNEVILATNPTLDGETTAIYLSKLLKPLGIATTRLASGIPVGGDLDYADEMTLLHAMDGRKEI